MILNNSKFPKCPLCFVRHTSYPKKCSDILIVGPNNKTHPKAKEMIEYLKEFKIMESLNAEASTGTKKHEFE